MSYTCRLIHTEQKAEEKKIPANCDPLQTPSPKLQCHLRKEPSHNQQRAFQLTALTWTFSYAL